MLAQWYKPTSVGTKPTRSYKTNTLIQSDAHTHVYASQKRRTCTLTPTDAHAQTRSYTPTPMRKHAHTNPHPHPPAYTHSDVLFLRKAFALDAA